MGKSFLQPALEYARAFYCVCPIRGKAPVHAGGEGYNSASRHLPEVEWLFKHRPQFRHTGLGIATGEVSGAWVLDVDGHDGEVSLRNLIREHGPLPHGPVTVTGNGLHHWFAYTPDCEPLRNRVAFLPGLDVRTNGGGVVVPPSPHPEGGFYRWRDVSLLEMEPPEAPAWLIREILPPPLKLPEVVPLAINPSRYAESALEAAERKIRNAPNGSQYFTLNGQAFSVGKWVAKQGYALPTNAQSRLIQAGMEMENHGKEPWREPQITRIVEKALRQGKAVGMGSARNAA